MKQLTLLLCLGAMAMSMNAQHISIEETNCRLDSVLMTGHNWDDVNSHKTIYSYDEQDHLVGIQNYSKIIEGGVLVQDWTSDYRTVITCDAAGRPIVSQSQSLEDGQWVDSYEKTTYEYDANGNCTKEDYYYLDAETKEYVLSRTMTLVYDSQNRITEELMVYNYGNQYKSIYEYGEYGVVSVTSYNKEENSDWVISTISEYEYNDKGQLVLMANKYDGGGEWYYTFCGKYTYNELGQLVGNDYYNGCQTDYNLLNYSNTTVCSYDEKGHNILDVSSDNEGIYERHEKTYDEHDDMLSELVYRRTYDPETWETLPELVLHEEIYYYYKCMGGNSIDQHPTLQAKHNGCILMNGKLVIVNGDKCYDLTGRAVK